MSDPRKNPGPNWLIYLLALGVVLYALWLLVTGGSVR